MSSLAYNDSYERAWYLALRQLISFMGRHIQRGTPTMKHSSKVGGEESTKSYI